MPVGLASAVSPATGCMHTWRVTVCVRSLVGCFSIRRVLQLVEGRFYAHGGKMKGGFVEIKQYFPFYQSRADRATTLGSGSWRAERARRSTRSPTMSSLADTPSRKRKATDADAMGSSSQDDGRISGSSTAAEEDTAKAGAASADSQQRTPVGASSTSRTPPGSSSSARRARVSFDKVRIRTHDVEMWGGGGVPADDGPPLGLGWGVQEEREVCIDAFEGEREGARTPKDSYCMVGCVEAGQRQQMLLTSGSTLKQIKAVTKQVAQLNQERWQASELLFGDAWLFRAPRNADKSELLAMLGQPDVHGCELSASNWHTAEACARELARSLKVEVGTLYAPSSASSAGLSSDDGAAEGGGGGGGGGGGEEGGEEGEIIWSACSEAMQNLQGQLVLLIRCDQVYSTGLALLGRLVGCVANSHIAAQVRPRCMHPACALDACAHTGCNALPDACALPRCMRPPSMHAASLVTLGLIPFGSFPSTSGTPLDARAGERGAARLGG